jgi:hypothetical protein
VIGLVFFCLLDFFPNHTNFVLFACQGAEKQEKKTFLNHSVIVTVFFCFSSSELANITKKSVKSAAILSGNDDGVMLTGIMHQKGRSSPILSLVFGDFHDHADGDSPSVSG